MRVLLLTLGSRGDVAPFVALGQALKTVGYEVRLATSDVFKSFTEENGIEYAYMNSGLVDLMEDPRARAALEGSKRKAFELISTAKSFIKRNLEEATKAAEGVNLIVFHPKALAGATLAEKLGVPGFLSLPTPFLTPTAAFANPLLGNFGTKIFNKLSYLPNRFSAAPYQGILNAWRQSLGLSKRSVWVNPAKDAAGRSIPTLYSCSPLSCPNPKIGWKRRISPAFGLWRANPTHPPRR